MKTNKYTIQDSLYQFPYHYIPDIENEGKAIRLHRALNWGLDYMTYMSFIKEVIQDKKPQSLIDIGCGDGRLVNLLKRDVPTVCGVDLSERALSFAKAFNPDVNFICGNISEIKDEYDMACVVEVLEHIPDSDISTFLSHVMKIVKKDGTLLVSVPTKNVLVNPKHFRHYTHNLLAKTLEPFFIIEQSWWLYRGNMFAKLLKFCLVNSFFILNATSLRSIIWNFHKSFTYMADESNGYHLICLAHPLK